MQTMLALSAALFTGIAQPESERPQLQISVTIYRAAATVPEGAPRRLTADERAQVMVCPPVATVEGKAATVFMGNEFARVANTIRRVVFVPQGLSLQVTPKAIMKDTVVLEMVLENSEGGDADRLRTSLTGTFVLDQPVMIEWPTRVGDRKIGARLVLEPLNR